MKIKNPFADLTKFEWILWGSSVCVTIISYFFSGNGGLLEMFSTLLGVTALIFVAKGYVIGQALTVVFGLFYAYISFECKYYGEMITYLFMAAPIALLATIEWIRHPYKGTKVVEVSRVSKKQTLIMIILSIIITIVLHYVLKLFGTANLAVSTISVTTSFIAAYLTYLRSPYYAIGYATNDVVLIVLWVLMSIKDVSYLPMIVCFLMFLANDLYGFFNWRKLRETQKANLKNMNNN